MNNLDLSIFSTSLEDAELELTYAVVGHRAFGNLTFGDISGDSAELIRVYSLLDQLQGAIVDLDSYLKDSE